MRAPRLYISICALLASLCCMAAQGEGYRSIVLECKVPAGQQVRIQLDASVSMRYDYGMLQITGRGVFVQLPLDNVTRWRYDHAAVDGVTGIDDPQADRADVDISRGSITVYGLESPTPVAVYDMSGRQLLALTACGDYTLQLDTLPRGLCILTVGSQSYKIMVE